LSADGLTCNYAITLYAHWSYPLNLVVDASGGTSGNPYLPYKGQSQSLSSYTPTTPPGYTFIGWSTNSDVITPLKFCRPNDNSALLAELTHEANSSFSPDLSDVTFNRATGAFRLYALFSPAWYTVTFYNEADAAIARHTVLRGSSVTPPVAPTRSGYSFTGWSTNAYTLVTMDLDIHPVYAPVNPVTPSGTPSTPTSPSTPSTPSSPSTSYTPSGTGTSGSTSSTATSDDGAAATPDTATDATGTDGADDGAVVAEVDTGAATGSIFTDNGTSGNGTYGSSTLRDDLEPMTGLSNGRTWALTNLVLGAAAMLIGLIATISALVRRRGSMFGLLSLVAGAVSLVVFFATGDMTGQVQFVDIWTIPAAVLFMAAFVTLILTMVSKPKMGRIQASG
jgi:hypothetical protein